MRAKFSKLVWWLQEWRNKLTARTWSEKSIIYYTGSTAEQWWPERLQTGLGGAESAVVYLAREWVKLGYQVIVYGNCGIKAGVYDGVGYLHYSQFNKYDKFSTLILWESRNNSLLDRPIQADRIWLDIHGVPKNEQQFLKERVQKLSKIFVKSEFHYTLFQYPLFDHISPEKFKVISNGITPSLLELSQNSKEPYRLIYASQYIRGLEQMLLYGWPIIKAEISAAELHIYYGWHFFDESYKNNPERQAWKQKMIELMHQSGVTEHGRVGQDKLAVEKSKSTIHYYATTMREIDCISVRESAAVGCVPVTTDYAALSEKPYCVKVPGNPLARETQEAVAWKIVELLKNQEQLAAMKKQFKELVKHETWNNIAKLWLEEF
ncbi:MAG TPA: group 1 glycosyl transferase [Cyanobacteria bacterium UBA8803]|nr:group 1 glycosyl transferase [Cyanobacteria bacterium UBA9273]HBL60408.1 group 1 glycosyl transferase [Cyanobacteria bacterium UBA8803]